MEGYETEVVEGEEEEEEDGTDRKKRIVGQVMMEGREEQKIYRRLKSNGYSIECTYNFNLMSCPFFQIEKNAPGLPAKIKTNSMKAWVFISNSSYDLYVSGRDFVCQKVLV